MTRRLTDPVSDHVFELDDAGRLWWLRWQPGGELAVWPRVVAQVECGRLKVTDMRSPLRHSILRLDLAEDTLGGAA